jgi:acyl carrier protein
LRAAMTQDEVFAKIGGILQADFKVPAAKITREATFRGTLGLDSLDAVDLIYLLGKAFGIKPKIESFANLHSVQQVVDHIVQVTGK